MYPSYRYIYWFVIYGSLLCGQSLTENKNFTNKFYRSKRNVDCGSSNTLKKYTFYPGHTVCLTASSSADLASSGVTADEKTEIVNKHNALRSLTQATNMMKMTWDDETAYIAQKWAENCMTSHESPGLKRTIPGRFGLGQNLFWGSGKDAWSAAIQSWYDEIIDFTFNGQNVFSKIGHYTQIVWAESVKVGCGYAQCNSSRTHFYVCNYGPAGNIGDTSKPYKQGTPCQDCPGNCVNKLCDCDKVCLNGGTLDLSTCACSCKSDYSGPDCSLNCATKLDPGYCGTQFRPSYCVTFSNVPTDCPHMCKICPNGGVAVTGSSDGKGVINFDLTGTGSGITSSSTIKTSEPVTVPSRSTSPGKTDISQSEKAVTEQTTHSTSDSSGDEVSRSSNDLMSSNPMYTIIIVSVLVIVLTALGVITVVSYRRKTAKRSQHIGTRQEETSNDMTGSPDFTSINYNEMRDIDISKMNENKKDKITTHRDLQGNNASVEMEENNCNKYESLATIRNSEEHIYESGCAHDNQYQPLTNQWELDEHAYESTDHAVSAQYQSLTNRSESDNHAYASTSLQTEVLQNKK